MSIVKEAFDKHARAVRRGFKSGREKTVGASEIGQCARKVWYCKHKAEYDPDFVDGWGAARRGTVFETRFFVPALRKQYGLDLLYAGTSAAALRAQAAERARPMDCWSISRVICWLA